MTAANLEAIAYRGPAREIAVRRMLRRSAELGYGLNFEDIIPGIAALGVPILSRGMPVASLSLATTRAALDDGGRRAVLLDRLRREASKIEGMIGQLRF